MKHSLPQRPLRFATPQAYDLLPRGSGSFWVERSAEHYLLDEPIGAPDGRETTAAAVAETGKTGAVGANPLRDEPGTLAVGVVKRFGLVGLVGVAVSSGIARWWNSFSSRDH